MRISLIGFDLAFTSIAHIPRIIGGFPTSVVAERSEWEALGDGVDARVTTDGDLVILRSGELNIEERREDLLLSKCMFVVLFRR